MLPHRAIHFAIGDVFVRRSAVRSPLNRKIRCRRRRGGGLSGPGDDDCAVVALDVNLSGSAERFRFVPLHPSAAQWFHKFLCRFPKREREPKLMSRRPFCFDYFDSFDSSIHPEARCCRRRSFRSIRASLFPPILVAQLIIPSTLVLLMLRVC